MKYMLYILLLPCIFLFEGCDHVFTFEGYSDTELGSATINDSNYYQIGSKYVFSPSAVTGLRSSDSLVIYQVKLTSGSNSGQPQRTSYEICFYMQRCHAKGNTNVNYKLYPNADIANLVDADDYLTVSSRQILAELKKCNIEGTAIVRRQGEHFRSYGGEFYITEIYNDGLRCRGVYTLQGNNVKINGKFDAILE